MTVSELLNRWRRKLDDTIADYGWTDAELIEYGADSIEEICENCFLVEEFGKTTGNITVSFNSSTNKIIRSTGSFIADGFNVNDEIHTTSVNNPGTFSISAISSLEITVNEPIVDETDVSINIGTAISTIFLSENTHTYNIDNRIIRINRVKLVSENSPLIILRERGIEYLDNNISDWENDDTGTPSYLLTHGIGENKVRFYKAPDANNTALLTVYRLPRNRLYITSSDISFSSITKTITKSTGGLGRAGFRVGDIIRVVDSSNNDGTYSIVSLTDNTIVTEQSLSNEPIGQNVTIINLSASPEFSSKYHKYIDNGVFAKAYDKKDSEVYDAQKVVFYQSKFKYDIETIKRSILKRNSHDAYAALLDGLL